MLDDVIKYPVGVLAFLIYGALLTCGFLSLQTESCELWTLVAIQTCRHCVVSSLALCALLCRHWCGENGFAYIVYGLLASASMCYILLSVALSLVTYGTAFSTCMLPIAYCFVAFDFLLLIAAICFWCVFHET